MSRPYNLLIITPDQMRADYLGCYGHPFIGTQHIDSLAKQGILFERCYCASPLCGPSRISFVTSTYVGEHGHRNYGSTISPDVPNLFCRLKEAGYRTGLYGKNHCFTYNRLPEVFDGLDEICLGNYDNHPHYRHSFSSFPLEADHPYNITHRLTSETLSFIRETPREQPFAAWLSFQDPHPAFTCPEPYFSLFHPEQFSLPENFHVGPDPDKPRRCANWQAHSEMALAAPADVRQAMATYCGQIRYVDDQVGRLMTALSEADRLKDTVICFFSDHGELLGDHGMFHKLPVFYECLTRIPVILLLPGRDWRGQRFRGLVEEVDLGPTLLDALGVEPPSTMVGRTLLPELEAGTDRGRPDVLVEAGGGAPTPAQPLAQKHKAPFAPNSFGPGAMVSDGRYKLSYYADDTPELYDLERDPGERFNRWTDPEYAAARSRLTERLLSRVLSVKVRDVGVDWPAPGKDPRFEPLEG